jgi:hypothetical protein
VGAGDRDQAGHLRDPGGEGLHLVPEVLVVGAQAGPEPGDDQGGGRDDDEEDGEELRGADGDDDEPAEQHGDRAEPVLRGLLHHLLDGLDVPDHLGLQDAGADPGVVADGQLLHPRAQRGPEAGAHAAHAAVQEADVEEVQRIVDEQDEQDDAGAGPQPRDRLMLDDGVDDGRGDERQQPDGAVLDREDADRCREAAPVGVEQVCEGAYRVFASVAMVEGSVERRRHRRWSSPGAVFRASAFFPGGRGLHR